MATITVQETPNPHARRFVVDAPVQEGPRGRSFKQTDDVDDPLAQELLQVFGVDSVMLLPNSVTVTKAPAAAWEHLDPAVREAIGRWLSP